MAAIEDFLNPDTSVITVQGQNCEVKDQITKWLRDQAFSEVRGDQLGAAHKSDDNLDNINDLIDRIQQWYMDTTLFDIPELSSYTPPTDEFTVREVTQAPTLEVTPIFPTAPAEPPIGEVDPALGMPDAPTFDAAEPTLNIPEAPALNTNALPAVPVLTSPEMPGEPDYVLPDLPSLYALTLPEVPLIVIEEFAGSKPNEPTQQISELNWSESNYTTTLIDAMNDRLLTFVNGASTGLTPAVEDAIWSRMRDRNNVEYQRKRDSARRTWSSAGFEMPDGFISARINQAEKEITDSQLSASRDVAIQQAQLEVENFRFSFEKALNLETLLSGLVNNKMNRALDAAKFVVSASVDALNAAVNLFNAKSNLYQVEASVYKTRIDAGLAKVQIYSAQIEAQQAIGQVNQNLVQMYSEQIKAVVSLFDLYKARLESVKILQDGDRLLLEKHRNELTGFSETIKQTATNIEGYAEVVRSETEKANIYRTLGDVFNSKINGYKTLADVKIAEKDFAIKANIDVPLRIMEQRTGIYSEQVKAEAQRIASLAQVFDSEIKGYTAYESNITERDKSFITDFSEQAKLYLGQINANTELSKIKSGESVTKATASLEAMRAMASIQGQIMAAQLAQYHVSRHVSASASSGVAQHFGCSSSYSDSVSISSSTSTTV